MAKEYIEKELKAFNAATGQFERVSPKVSTETIYNEKGETLDEILKITPDGLIKILQDILDGAPDAYNTFREVADALDKNKDSIASIFIEIDRRVKKPAGGKAGQVLTLDDKGNIVFGDGASFDPTTIEAKVLKTDPLHRFVSDDEKRIWDGKVNSVNGKTSTVEITARDIDVEFDKSKKLEGHIQGQRTDIDDLKKTVQGMPKHVVLTQAEYDALSSTQKNDPNTFYYIKKA